MKAFPLRFNFSTEVWRGARARLHSAREDAFQQLVGDALRTFRPSFIETFSTAGRDGSIDVFVAATAPLPGLFAELPTPIIVECKDNDDECDDVLENVIASWRKLASKLQRKAADKWPDLYQPWLMARGYVYATSAVLPHKRARDDLYNRIRNFFERLRESKLCSIEHVRVLDWADLRWYFDTCPGLSDRWLGIDTPALLSHEERINQLTGFSRYLRTLPFVEPSAGKPTHPRVIFSEARQVAGQQGLLLLGTGGVGKTRTLLEVADLAVAAGWRVLHTAGWGHELTQDELAREILDGRADTLLVIDYLNQLKIDFRWVRVWLLPEAGRRGINIAMIAAGRPAHATQLNDDRRRYFKKIRLEPDVAQANQIIEVMLDHAAEHAVRALGRERVRRLAGRRPIIALFVMKELERQNSTLTADMRGPVMVRSDELLNWIGARLDEDSLASQRSSSLWESSSPGPELLASAAVLCAAPQSRQSLVDVAAHVLSSYEKATGTALRTDAFRIVDVLVSLGWIEARDDGLAVAHDVVAEEVLLRCFDNGLPSEFKQDTMRHILAASARSAKVLARTLGVFARVANVEPDIKRALDVSVSRWVAENEDVVGSVIVSSDGDVADMAIYWLTSNQQWISAVSDVYGKIILPFLERHGMRANAALPIVQILGCSQVLQKDAVHLFGAAVSWCKMHASSDDAHLVARVMLMCNGIPHEIANSATEVSYDIAVSGHSDSRVSLIGALLARPELGRIRGQELIRAVRGDLVGYTQRCVPRFGVSLTKPDGVEHFEMMLLMKSLMENHEIPPDMTSDVLDCAVASLWYYRRGEGAAWLLPAMLRAHADFGTRRVSVVRKIARRWLNIYAGCRRAGNALAAICAEPESLERPDVLGDAVLVWLDRHGDSSEASTLLHAALGSAFLQEDVKRRVEAEALRWLEKYADIYTAANVIVALLRRQELSAEAARSIISYATVWIERNISSVKLHFVLDPLFQRKELDAELRDVLVDRSVQWLTHHPNVDAALLVIKQLMRVSEMSLSRLEEAMRSSLSWVRYHHDSWIAGVAFMEMFACVHRVDSSLMSGEMILELLNLSIDWLRRHPDAPFLGAFIVSLVYSGIFPVAAAVYVVEPVLNWILSSDGADPFEIRAAKWLLRYCIENGSDEQRATVRRLCQGVVDGLLDSEIDKGLLAELGLV